MKQYCVQVKIYFFINNWHRLTYQYVSVLNVPSIGVSLHRWGEIMQKLKFRYLYKSPVSSTLPKPNPKPRFFQKTQPNLNPKIWKPNLNEPRIWKLNLRLGLKTEFILGHFSKKISLKKKIIFLKFFNKKIKIKLSLQ